MGGHSSTQMQQRPLSDEEKALYARQLAYMQEVSPYITQLLNKGGEQLNMVYNPDWKGLIDTYSSNINDIMKRQEGLLNGEVPQQFQDAKKTYYDNLYKNTMGKGMQAMANSGVINSSRFNTAAKDWQNTMANQMSKDYTNDINTVGNLLNQRESWLQNGLLANAQAGDSSVSNAMKYFSGASGLQNGNTQALQGISQNENGRTYTVTKQKQGLGSVLGGIASVGSLFT